MVDHSDAENGLQDLFTQDGKPLRFLLDSTIQGHQRRAGLRNRIEEHGGTVVASLNITDILLVDQPASERLKRQSALDMHPDRGLRNIWVEHFEWVKRAIRIEEVVHVRPKEGMPGYIKRPRNEYTDDDDKKLALYLSRRIPHKEQGGRQGDNIYKHLCELPDILNEQERESCMWVKRHPWQSWRNRYNKNKERFDEMIDELVAADPPEEARTYHLDRRLGAGSNRGVRKGYNEEGEGEEDDLEEQQQQPRRKRTKVKQEPVDDDSEVEFVEPKGKEKEVAEDGQGQGHDDPEYNTQMFDPSGPGEAGPSGTQRRGSVPRSIPHEDPPSFPPAASQATLVGNEVWPPARGRRSEPVPRNAGRMASRKVASPLKQRHVARTPSPELSAVPALEASQPPPEIEDYEAELEPFPPPPQFEIQQPSTPPQPPSPAPQSPPVRKRKRTKNPPQVLRVEGPYRNTRSRSRSVEPTAAPPARRQRRTRRDVSDNEDEGPLDTLAEDVQAENVPGSPAVPTASVSVPVTETFGDELDVEEILMGQVSTGTGGGSHVQEDVTEGNAAEIQDEQEEEPEEEDEDMEQDQGDDENEDQDYGDVFEDEEMREDEKPEEEATGVSPTPDRSASPPRRLSSDDRDVADFLKTRFHPSPEVSETDPDPDDALAAFNQLIQQTSRPVSGASMTGRGSRVASSGRRRSGNNDIVGTSSGQQRSRMMDPPPNRLAQTPRPSLTRQRRGSESSAESIPLSGTRASEFKLQLEDQEKGSPYKPPPGTRAAKITRKTKGRGRR